jgi:hypothetical protein
MANGGGSTAYGKLYINDAPAGNEHSTTATSMQQYYDDITLAAGDRISIYCKTSDVSYPVTIGDTTQPFSINVAETLATQVN